MLNSVLDQQAETAINALWDVFLTYGIPALLLCLVLSYVSAKISARKRAKGKNSSNKRAWRKD